MSFEANANLISTLNSRAASTLAAGATFQGVSEDVSNYGRAGIAVTSSNATDGVLTIEVSQDGVNWGGPSRNWEDTRFGQPHMWNIVEKYFRILYTNGTTEATDLAIQVQYSKNADILLAHQLTEVFKDETEAIATRSVLVGQTTGGDYINVPVAGNGHIQVDIPKTAFDEMLVAEVTPLVQSQFTYGINSLQFLQFPGNGGSIAGIGGMAVLNSGTSADGFALLLSNDVVRYNAGQGTLSRFSGVFDAGVADSEQTIGLAFNLHGLFFGYNGADFGILRRTGGQTEMRKLTVTTASSTAENITITLDGDADATVTVTASGDPAVTAKEIADHNYLSVGDGWATEVAGNEVTFFSINASSHPGSYSLSGATTAVGNFTQLAAGNASTDSWVAQTAWNGDVMDGTGRSGITLDPTKGNVFQIRYEWLGFGRIQFSIQNPNTGEFIEVHSIPYGNANTTPSLDNPTMALSMTCRNLGSTTDLTLKSASMAGLIEGIDSDLGPTFSCDRLFTIGNVTTEEPVLTVRGMQPYNGLVNQIRNELLSFSLTSDLNDARAVTTFRVYIGATPINGTSYADVATGQSATQCDKSATDLDITGAEEIDSFILSATESKIIDLRAIKERIAPPQTITITAQPSKGHSTNQAGAARNWRELI